MGVDAECLECGEYNKDGGPPVVERERQVDENLIGPGFGHMVFLYDIVDVLRKLVGQTCGTNVLGERRTVTAELTQRASTKAKKNKKCE